MTEKKDFAYSLYEENWDTDAWELVDPNDLWVLDKLIVAKKCGYKCGPMGSIVPAPAQYIIRPVINNSGMGFMARFELIAKEAMKMHPAEFWCEIFHGRHLSVDYEWGKQILAVEGIKHPAKPLQRFIRWSKVEDKIDIPEFLSDVAKRYRYMNCEFIGGNLIEVHFRRNPDFRWGNSVMIPCWSDEPMPEGVEGMTYKSDPFNYPEGRAGVFIA